MDPKDDKVELIDKEDDPWIKLLNALQDTLLEQYEPPTEDNSFQIDLGDEANPKPIFICETLSQRERGQDSACKGANRCLSLELQRHAWTKLKDSDLPAQCSL